MDRPFRYLCVVCVVTLGWWLTAAETATDTGVPGSNPGRPISARTAALLQAALPKYEPAPVDPNVPAPPVILKRAGIDEPESDIVRLPRYVVRDTKIPPAARVDPGPYQRHLMEQYLGPENGLDRGFLNAVTIADVWYKIPVLRWFTFASSISNADRAALLYAQDERLQKKRDLSDLISVSKQPKNAPENVKLRRELEETFMRKK